MSDPAADGPHLHALLIGVDRYLQPRLPAPLSYPSLAGAVADVARVEELLLRRLGVAPERIRKLTASHGEGDEPPEAPEDRPTYDHLVAAFRRLREVARPGEQVLVHYSGHGGRARTTLPEAKGEGGLDECLVPYDFVRSGRYLRDTEIHVLVRELVDAGLQVTLVFDCCHAGGTLREGFEGRVAVRGIPAIDRAHRPRESRVTSPAELAARWRRLQELRRQGGSPYRGLAGSRSFVEAPWGYVLLAACRPHESAYEASFDDGLRWGGALTHHLLETLWEGGSELSYHQLYGRLLARIHARFPSQTPQLEGEGSRLVLGRRELPTRYGVTVLAGESSESPGRIELATGQAQCVRKGAAFALYPAPAVQPGVAADGDDGHLAVAEIVQLGATRSLAQVRRRLRPEPPVQPGDQAVLLDPGGLCLRRPVRRLRRFPQELEEHPPAGPEGAVVEAATLSRLERALAARRSGFLELAEGESQVDGFAVRVDARGAYEILDAGGVPLPNLRPEIPVNAPQAAERVVERLVHLARYRNVQQLANRHPAAPLRGKLRVGLERLPPEGEAREPVGREPVAATAGGALEVRVGEWVRLTVKNRSDQVLNLAVLDLRPDWAIVQIHPSATRGSFDPMDPGEVKRLTFEAELPSGTDQGIDVVKVFATTGPVSYRWLELPPLDVPFRGKALPGPPANDLERLFAALAVEAPATRSGGPPLPEGGGWWVEGLEVIIARN